MNGLESTSTIIEFAESISDLGIMVVCSAILLIFCLVMFRNQQKTIQDLKKLVAQLSRPQEHPDEEDFEMLDLINSKIYTELSLLLQSLNCDRSYIYLYHNGGVSSSGLFFQRMSCISEVVGPGVLPVSAMSQNLHRSSYSKMLNLLQENGEWGAEDVLQLRDADGYLYQRFRSTHSESVHIAALKGSQGHVIGFVGVDYCSLNYDVEVELIKSTLRKTSSVISTLVDIRGEVSDHFEEDTK